MCRGLEGKGKSEGLLFKGTHVLLSYFPAGNVPLWWFLLLVPGIEAFSSSHTIQPTVIPKGHDLPERYMQYFPGGHAFLLESKKVVVFMQNDRSTSPCIIEAFKLKLNEWWVSGSVSSQSWYRVPSLQFTEGSFGQPLAAMGRPYRPSGQYFKPMM